MGQIQRHRDVAQTAVHPDHTRALRHLGGELVQRQTGPHHSARQHLGHGYAAQALGFVTVGQSYIEALLFQTQTQIMPMRHGPFFVRT